MNLPDNGGAKERHDYRESARVVHELGERLVSRVEHCRPQPPVHAHLHTLVGITTDEELRTLVASGGRE